MADDARREIVLERHRETIVHVDLDRDEQELAHSQDGDSVHGYTRLVYACFLVTEKPAGAATALLGPTLRERLTALAGASLAGFVCNAQEVVVLLHGVEVDADVLGVALDAVAEAAARPT